MNNSATIQKILKIETHSNADMLEIATVLGWKCVTKRGEFKEGDLVIYIEIDSLLPKLPQYEFVKNTKKDENGIEYYYVKNIRLRGQLSQGLILPFNKDILRGIWSDDEISNILCNSPEGTDFSKALGIKHYEKPIPVNMKSEVLGNFPSFLYKTDEVRIQSNPELLKKLKNQQYYITEKIDGTSATYYYKDGKFGVCSRNLELKENENNIYWKIAKQYNLENILKECYEKHNEQLCFQGEIYGEGIQKNPLQIKGQKLAIFNIYDIKDQRNLKITEIYKYCDEYNLQTVEIVELNEAFNYTIDELLEKAKGNYKNTQNKREGIVIRDIDRSTSFKVINNEYED